MPNTTSGANRLCAFRFALRRQVHEHFPWPRLSSRSLDIMRAYSTILMLALFCGCASQPRPQAVSGGQQAPVGGGPIPLASTAPWVQVFASDGFRIALDTSHVQKGPEGGLFMWFVTLHAAPRSSDSFRFDRGRIQLLVRCRPLAFKSVSQELALGDAVPVFRQNWPVEGPGAAPWRTPEPGSTDDRFLREACRIVGQR
jgi:hypothetical protein